MDYLGTQGITSDAASINEVLTKLKKDQLKSDTCDRVSCPQCLNSAKGYCPEKVEKETSTTTGEEHNWDDGASTSAAGGTEPTAAPVKRSEGIAFKADNNVSQGFIAGSADVRSPKAEERAMDKVEGVDGLMEKEAFPQSLQGSPSTHTIHIYSSSIDLSSPSTNSAIDNTTANIATHMSSAGSVNTTTRSGCRGLVGRPPVPTNSASNATNARKVMSNSKRKPLASLATNSATNNVNNANVPSLALHSPVKVGDSFETLKRKMRMGSFKRGDSGSQIQNENNENSIVNNNNNTGLGSCLGTEDVTASNTNSNCTAGPPSADPLEESQESDDGMDIRKAEDARYPLSPLRSLAFSLTTSQTDEQQQVPAFLLSSFVNECVEEALSTRVSKERAMHA